jgi:hypothetical protein
MVLGETITQYFLFIRSDHLERRGFGSAAADLLGSETDGRRFAGRRARTGARLWGRVNASLGSPRGTQHSA